MFSIYEYYELNHDEPEKAIRERQAQSQNRPRHQRACVVPPDSVPTVRKRGGLGIGSYSTLFAVGLALIGCFLPARREKKETAPGPKEQAGGTEELPAEAEELPDRPEEPSDSTKD